MSTQIGASSGAAPAVSTFRDIQASERFRRLRSRHRRIVFPLAGAFLLWYFLYMVLAAYAHDFMSIRVTGNITLGLVFGLAQIVTTFIITVCYVMFANRSLDPQAEQLRVEIEAGLVVLSRESAETATGATPGRSDEGTGR